MKLNLMATLKVESYVHKIRPTENIFESHTKKLAYSATFTVITPQYKLTMKSPSKCNSVE